MGKGRSQLVDAVTGRAEGEIEMFLDKTKVDANKLMQLAWDNPLLDENDCALLFQLIMEAMKEEDA